MDNIISRIRIVFKDSGLTQTEIANKLDVTPQYVWKIMNNDNSRPRNNIIKGICREFMVNEDWLRTGKGNHYVDKNDKLTSYLSTVLTGNDKFIKSLIETYMELDQTSKDLIKKFVCSISEKM